MGLMEDGVHPPRIHLQLNSAVWRNKVVAELAGFPLLPGPPPPFSDWPSNGFFLVDAETAEKMSSGLENDPAGYPVIHSTLVIPSEPISPERQLHFFQRGFAFVHAGDFTALRARLQNLIGMRSNVLAENALNRRLRQHLNTRQAVYSNQSDFLNMAVHDLRGPLAAMICYAELLMEGVLGNLQSTQLDPIRTIHRNCQFLIDMVNDLLDSARLESGKLALNLERVNFSKEVENAAQALRSLADAKSIKIRIESEEIPPLFLDVQKIGRTLSNLIGNAIKFSLTGGEIVLNSRCEGNTLIFSIQDMGQGILDGDRRAIFEKFRTGSRSDITGKGLGLGLHICKSFIELHGGRIYVESVRHKGSVFIVHLPLEKRRSRTEPGLPRKIRIVDLCGDIPDLASLSTMTAPGIHCTVQRVEISDFLSETRLACDWMLVNEGPTPFGEKFLLLYLAELGIPCGLLVSENMSENGKDLRKNMGFWLQTKTSEPREIFDTLKEMTGMERRRRSPKPDQGGFKKVDLG